METKPPVKRFISLAKPAFQDRRKRAKCLPNFQPTAGVISIGGKEEVRKNQPDAVVRRLGPFHVPQIYGSAMDSATSVDDAALPRSRPKQTTLIAEQAEMFISQVPIPFFGLKMRFRKCFTELPSLLWILLLYQISQSSCASIRNYSLESVNFSVIQSDLTAPKKLSELIEFSPLNLPVELENISIIHEEMKETTPKIITLRLKTHLTVRNHGDSNQTDIHDANREVNIMTPNTSESSLADIEYLDSGNDFEFWKWKSSSRARRMNPLSDEMASIGNNSAENKSSSEEDSLKTIAKIYDSEDSRENQISRQVRRSKYASGRQFVFHPYLLYGKDTAPDEKISFDDILPVKMVKFVKSMVEEAPWEQMFMKMVRMIVDQFVDKIIEKMFADKHHDDHFLKRRSLEFVLPSPLVLPTFETPVVRMKRAVSNKPSSDEDDYEDLFNFEPSKKTAQDVNVEGKKSDSERMTWLDHFLDFVFPNSKSDDTYGDEFFDRLKKRDTTHSNAQLIKKLIAFFIKTFEKSSGFIADAKDALRYKMLKEFLPFLYQKRYSNANSGTSPNTVDDLKMTHRKLSPTILERNDVIEDTPSRSRSKRSTRHHRKDDENRLWQSYTPRHRPLNQRSRDECSLRKACNAGRLLSRLPSVQEITLQLRSNGNEPHWDALIWGMKKKRCSRVFCKRQRSPKGSRHYWDDAEKPTTLRKDEIVTEPPDAALDENNNLAA